MANPWTGKHSTISVITDGVEIPVGKVKELKDLNVRDCINPTRWRLATMPNKTKLSKMIQLTIKEM